MATIQKFEDLICWQRARELTKEIYRMFQGLKFKDYGLQDQMQRAAVSVMSNIAEGFERGTKQEFLNYLYIAKGSAGEVRAQLYVALDAGYLNFEIFKRLNFMVRECSQLISRFTESLKVSKFKGLQYKSADSSKYRKMPEHVKDLLEAEPEMREYYDEKTGQIEWWRVARDKEKKKKQNI